MARVPASHVSAAPAPAPVPARESVSYAATVAAPVSASASAPARESAPALARAGVSAAGGAGASATSSSRFHSTSSVLDSGTEATLRIPAMVAIREAQPLGRARASEHLCKVTLIDQGSSAKGPEFVSALSASTMQPTHISSFARDYFRIYRDGSENIEFQLGFSAGTERFRTIDRAYFRDASVVMLMIPHEWTLYLGRSLMTTIIPKLNCSEPVPAPAPTSLVASLWGALFGSAASAPATAPTGGGATATTTGAAADVTPANLPPLHGYLDGAAATDTGSSTAPKA